MMWIIYTLEGSKPNPLICIIRCVSSVAAFQEACQKIFMEFVLYLKPNFQVQKNKFTIFLSKNETKQAS